MTNWKPITAQYRDRPTVDAIVLWFVVAGAVAGFIASWF